MLTAMIAGARAAGGDGYHLISALCAARGVRVTATVGQVRLANRLVLGPKLQGRLIGALGDDGLSRILTGEVAPAEDAAEHIAEATAGAVLPHMFARPDARCEIPERLASKPARAHAPDRGGRGQAGGGPLPPPADTATLFVSTVGSRQGGAAVIGNAHGALAVPRHRIGSLIRSLERAAARLDSPAKARG